MWSCEHVNICVDGRARVSVCVGVGVPVRRLFMCERAYECEMSANRALDSGKKN